MLSWSQLQPVVPAHSLLSLQLFHCALLLLYRQPRTRARNMCWHGKTGMPERVQIDGQMPLQQGASLPAIIDESGALPPGTFWARWVCHRGIGLCPASATATCGSSHQSTTSSPDAHTTRSDASIGADISMGTHAQASGSGTCMMAVPAGTPALIARTAPLLPEHVRVLRAVDATTLPPRLSSLENVLVLPRGGEVEALLMTDSGELEAGHRGLPGAPICMLVYDASLVPPPSQSRHTEDSLSADREPESAVDAAVGHDGEDSSAATCGGGGSGDVTTLNPRMAPAVSHIEADIYNVNSRPDPPEAPAAVCTHGSVSADLNLKVNRTHPAEFLAADFVDFLRRDRLWRIERELLALSDYAAEGDGSAVRADAGGGGVRHACLRLAGMHAAALRFAETGVAIHDHQWHQVMAELRRLPSERFPDYLGGCRRSETVPGRMAFVATQMIAAAAEPADASAGAEPLRPEAGPNVRQPFGNDASAGLADMEMLQFADEDLLAEGAPGDVGVAAERAEQMLSEWTYHVAQLMWRSALSCALHGQLQIRTVAAEHYGIPYTFVRASR